MARLVSSAERVWVEVLSGEGLSDAEIAALRGRERATVRRERKRCGAGAFCALGAQADADARANRPMASKLAADAALGRNSAVAPTLKNFIGATTTITHNSSIRERNTTPHTRRTLALRPIPENDLWFARIFGLREDAESIFSGVKADLRDRRCRTKGKNSVHFNLLAYQIKTLITALVAHNKRTGDDLSK